MRFDPGVRFFRNTNGMRFWMDNWINKGSIVTTHDSFLNTIFFSDSSASILEVAATNIVNTGPLSSGAHGLIRLEGKRIDLTRNGLRTGADPFTINSFSGGFLGLSNYVNDLGVTDLYWAAGTNNNLMNRGGAMTVDGSSAAPFFNVPNVSSPSHQVIELLGSSFPFTNSTIIPGSFFFGTNFLSGTNQPSYDAAAYTTSLSPTSSIVQVVFFPTNGLDSNFTTSVQFITPPAPGQPATVVVAFNSVDLDIVTHSPTVETVYLTA